MSEDETTNDTNALPNRLTFFYAKHYGPLFNIILKFVPADGRLVALTGDHSGRLTRLLEAQAFALGAGPDYWNLRARVPADADLEVGFVLKGQRGSRALPPGKAGEGVEGPVLLLDVPSRLAGRHLDIAPWMRQMLLGDAPGKAARYESIRALWGNVLPGISHVHMKQGVLHFEGADGVNGHGFSWEQKAVAAMVFQILTQLFAAYPMERDPASLSGIVLVDFLELGLSPEMQAQLPDLLCETFPLVQFIITTQSPAVCERALALGQLFRLGADALEEVQSDVEAEADDLPKEVHAEEKSFFVGKVRMAPGKALELDPELVKLQARWNAVMAQHRANPDIVKMKAAAEAASHHSLKISDQTLRNLRAKYAAAMSETEQQAEFSSRAPEA